MGYHNGYSSYLITKTSWIFRFKSTRIFSVCYGMYRSLLQKNGIKLRNRKKKTHTHTFHIVIGIIAFFLRNLLVSGKSSLILFPNINPRYSSHTSSRILDYLNQMLQRLRRSRFCSNLQIKRERSFRKVPR